MKLLPLPLRFAVLPVLACCTSAIKAQENSNKWATPPVGGECIIGPSPEVAAMRQYSDFPVSYASGSADIRIPLAELPGCPAGVSLSLSYRTGGIKKRDMQSAVGLGWSLTGLGSVSRQVNGFPDEWRGGSNQQVTFDVRDIPYDIDYLRSVIECRTETEYDMYSYNIPGYSGSFMIVNGSIVQLPQNDVVIERKADSRNSLATESFSITTPDGLRYLMTEQEHTSYQYIPHPDTAEYYDRSYDGAVTAWHVTRISHPEITDAVSISYYPMQGWRSDHNTGLTCFSYSYNYSTPATPEYDTRSVSFSQDGSTSRTIYHDQRIPYEITAQSGRIIFDISMCGDQKLHDRPADCIRRIRVLDNSFNEIRRVDFDNAGMFSDNRRRLDGLTISSDNMITGSYRFSYCEEAPYDGYDLFGYPNGRNRLNAESMSVLNTDLNRMPDREGNRYCIASHSLCTVTDIAGVTTSLKYEPSSIYVSGGVLKGEMIIGNRVKNITTTDAVTGRHRTRSYRYENPSSSIELGSFLDKDFRILSGTHFGNVSYQTYCYSLSCVLSASARLRGAPLENARIYYGKVTETLSGTGVDKPVQTVYEYDLSHMTCPVVTGEWHGFHGNTYLSHHSEAGKNLGNLVGKTYSDSEKRLIELNPTRGYSQEQKGVSPLLTAKTVYEWINSTYQPRVIERFSYSAAEDEQYRTGIYAESVVFRFVGSSMMQTCQSQLNVTDMNDVHYFVTYLRSKRLVMNSHTVTDIYPDGNRRTKTTSYIIKPKGSGTEQLPGFYSDSLLTVSGMQLRPLGSITTCGDESVAIYNALTRHAVTSSVLRNASAHGIKNLPLAEKRVFSTSQGRDSVITRYRYSIFEGGGGHSLTLPHRVTVETAERQDGLRAIISEQRYHSYDIQGNITSMTDRGGRRISARWEPGYSLLSELSLPDVGLTTRYTHRPLVGCTSITTPSGQVRRFGYSAGRLSEERNTAGDLVASYTYQFYGDSVPQTGDRRANRITATVHDTSGQASDVTYYDGFGLPVQTVSHVAGGGLVRSAVTYDALDRPVRRYLPVPSGDDGYVSDFPSTAAGYYGDSRPFSQLTYRTTADDRPVQVLREGEAMREHPGRYEYLCNNEKDGMLRCRRYRLADRRDSESVTLGGYYPAGALDVTRTTGPDGCTLLTFTDWRGFVILERRVVSDNTFADTYRLYDVLGNVRVIIQPKGAALMTREGKTWTRSDAEMERYAFVCRYDRRGNLVYSRVPGAGAVEMRYDPLNRPAFRQTAAMRGRGETEFTLYDPIGRIAVTGISYGEMPAADSVPVMTTSYSGSDDGIGGTGYPAPEGLVLQDAAVTSASYYDSYGCLSMDGFRTLPADTLSLDSALVRGRPAAARTAYYSCRDSGGVTVSDAVRSVYSVCGYDTEGNRTAEVSSTMLPGIFHTVSRGYSRLGYETSGREYVNVDGPCCLLRSTSSRDPKGSLLRATAVMGDRPAPEPGTANSPQYTYNALGQLESVSTGTTVGYTYNMRGEVTSVTSPVFSQTLGYENGETPCRNGNISRMTVSYSGGSPVTRQFSYDRMNRLAGMTSSDGYSTAYSYTLNSGPLSVTRRGMMSDGTAGTVDDLTYSYDGNRVIRIQDDADPVILESSSDFAGDRSDYTYDADGALYSDSARGIGIIEYAPTGQPVAIRGTDGTLTARYVCSSDGRKLSSGVSETPHEAPSVTRYYIGPFEFSMHDRHPLRIPSLEIIRIPWGEILYDGITLSHITDHQGNVRAVVEPDSGIVTQTTDYYPYGLPMATSTGQEQNRYKYSGKEFETRRGLNFHDFEARMLFSDRAMFNRPDPKAQDYSHLSPYSYCAGNPIRYIDPTGEAWKPSVNEETGEIYDFIWIDVKDSYDNEGNLLDGLYEQAILFSESGINGTFNLKSSYNIGTSTATVYKLDGITESFDACTYPSDTNKFATIPGGLYEAHTGKHGKSQYNALRLGDVGTSDFKNNTIELGKQNPSQKDGITYAKYINIHKAGINNYTGITENGTGVSEGCLLIDRNSWTEFIKNFYQNSQENNIIGVIIRR